jgi:hypothetical protein
MSTTAKLAIGVAGVAIVYFVLRARAAANEANSYSTSTPPAPAPMPPLTPQQYAAATPALRTIAKTLRF